MRMFGRSLARVAPIVGLLGLVPVGLTILVVALLPTIADAGRARGHGASRGSGGRSTYAQAKHRFELAKKAPPRQSVSLGRSARP